MAIGPAKPWRDARLSFARALRSPGTAPAAPALPASHVSQAAPTTPISLVVIAISTGGPAALAELIPQLPPGMRQPILIVQHMPPVFTRILAQRLASSSTLPVREAVHRDHLEPGCILLAPGDHHLRVAGNPRDPFVTLDRTGPNDVFPLNTSSGSQGSGRMHGIPQLMDGALQVMGRSGPRQVKDAALSLVVCGAPQLAGGVIYSKHPSL